MTLAEFHQALQFALSQHFPQAKVVITRIVVIRHSCKAELGSTERGLATFFFDLLSSNTISIPRSARYTAFSCTNGTQSKTRDHTASKLSTEQA